MRLLLLFSLLFILRISPAAQTRVTDSLRRVIHSSVSGDEKLNAIYSLSNGSVNADTLYMYLALADALAAGSVQPEAPGKAEFSRGVYYVKKNYIDSALSMTESMLSRSRQNPLLRAQYLSALFLRAKILDRGNRFTQTISELVKVIHEAENQQDTLMQIQAKTGIGWVMIEMEQYKDALQWLYKARATSANHRFYKNYSALYSNIAAAHNALGNEDSALWYIRVAIKDARENENEGFLATALSLEARIYLDHNKPALAEAPLKEVVEVRRKINDPFYTVFDISSLAGYYALTHQPEKGIVLCQEGIQLAKDMGLHSQLLMIYRSLAENYKVAGQTDAYSHTLEKIIILKDSFATINTTRQIAELEARDQDRKNEKTILEQKLNLTVKNYWLFGSLILGVLALVIFRLLFSNYRRRHQEKLRTSIEKEKEQSARSVKEAEEQERKRIAADLHDNIGAYASAIQADVETIARQIPADNSLYNLQQHAGEIITSLRDTIWVLNKEQITITGISDRIKNFLQKLSPSYPEKFIAVQEMISDDRRLSSRQALNIFRIVQEAVHNALKHSGADTISILINSNETLSITIEDDGTGLGEQVAEGNGLRNIRNRAIESGLTVTFSQREPAGTIIRLNLYASN